jgi:hypothetical protein
MKRIHQTEPSQVTLPASLKAILCFPLRTREGLLQVLLVTLVFLGLQIGFPPLALVVEAGYGLQAARRILLGEGLPALPERLDWRQILVDGARWWGAALLFYSPGLALWLATTAAGLTAIRLAGSGAASPRLVWFLFVFGWGTALSLVVVGGELATVAAMNGLRRGSFAGLFRLREWGPVMRARFLAFELAAVLRLGLSVFVFLAVVVLSIPALLLCIGPGVIFSLAAIYLRLVSSAATAQIYREGLERTGQVSIGREP